MGECDVGCGSAVACTAFLLVAVACTHGVVTSEQSLVAWPGVVFQVYKEPPAPALSTPAKERPAFAGAAWQPPPRDKEPLALGATPAPSALSSNASAHTATCVPPNNKTTLVYHYFSKSGITTMQQFLMPSIAKQFRMLRAMDYPHVAGKNEFMLGTIRYPCDWYVSLWAYSVLKHTGPIYSEIDKLDAAMAKDIFNQDGPPASEENIKRFRHFIKYTMTEWGVPFGVYTTYFAASYVTRTQILLDHTNITPLHPNVVAMKQVQKRMSWQNLTNATGIHCWSRTEHIVEDLRHCLQRYECEAGGTVSWEKFNRLQAQEEAGKLNKNPSKHSTCSRYIDAETEALIRKYDSLMFGLFEPSFWQPQSCCYSRT